MGYMPCFHRIVVPSKLFGQLLARASHLNITRGVFTTGNNNESALFKKDWAEDIARAACGVFFQAIAMRLPNVRPGAAAATRAGRPQPTTTHAIDLHHIVHSFASHEHKLMKATFHNNAIDF